MCFLPRLKPGFPHKEISMTRILVTGGTGVLGREVVRRLTARVEVRVLSRKCAPVGNTQVVRGDLATGEGLAAALDGVDVIVHCASSIDYRHPERDVEGTWRLLEAAVATGREPHIVYISVVGVDRIPFSYYEAKLTTERLIEESGLPWTTLRATQFHDLILMFLMLLAKGPVAIVPRGFRAQPVETGEVADWLAGLALGEPAAQVPDIGGPRVERIEDMMRAYLTAVGRRRPVLRVPVPGRTARAFRAGGNLVDDGTTGSRTFAEFLRSRVGPDGSVTPPYDLKRWH
jgi:uncharacterized protein YbjT (DUF2867 family)